MSFDLKSFLKDAGMQITAGGSAGFVEVCIMHPLDLVKTRLQIQTKAPSSIIVSAATVGGGGGGIVGDVYYNGVADCFKKMIKAEGFTSLWKGVLPPILADTPKRAVKFLTFEQYKRFFMFGSDKPTPLVCYDMTPSLNIKEMNGASFKETIPSLAKINRLS